MKLRLLNVPLALAIYSITSAAAYSAYNVEELTCEFLKNPIGIEAKKPLLG